MSNEELKPCPFCGEDAYVERMGTNKVSMQIQCGWCGARMESGETWIDENTNWNKRTTDRLEQESAELREALESMVSTIDTIWIEQAFTQDKEKCIVNYKKAKQLLNK